MLEEERCKHVLAFADEDWCRPSYKPNSWISAFCYSFSFCLLPQISDGEFCLKIVPQDRCVVCMPCAALGDAYPLLVENNRLWEENLSVGSTLADNNGRVMPMERFEPSTLAGPVFETGAYTVPPHRPGKPPYTTFPLDLPPRTGA